MNHKQQGLTGNATCGLTIKELEAKREFAYKHWHGVTCPKCLEKKP